MPFQGLALHSGSFHQLIHRQFARVFHPLQQFRLSTGEIQHSAAGGKGPILPGAVVRHIGEGQSKLGQLLGKLLNLPAAGGPYLKLLGMIHCVGNEIQQFLAVLFSTQGGVERNHLPMALL